MATHTGVFAVVSKTTTPATADLCSLSLSGASTVVILKESVGAMLYVTVGEGSTPPDPAPSGGVDCYPLVDTLTSLTLSLGGSGTTEVKVFSTGAIQYSVVVLP